VEGGEWGRLAGGGEEGKMGEKKGGGEEKNMGCTRKYVEAHDAKWMRLSM